MSKNYVKLGEHKKIEKDNKILKIYQIDKTLKFLKIRKSQN